MIRNKAQSIVLTISYFITFINKLQQHKGVFASLQFCQYVFWLINCYNVGLFNMKYISTCTPFGQFMITRYCCTLLGNLFLHFCMFSVCVSNSTENLNSGLHAHKQSFVFSFDIIEKLRSVLLFGRPLF